MIRQLVGDCRVQLATIEPGSVQACITSPPYWGLRDYGTPPLVWGGDAEHAHEWGAPTVRGGGKGHTTYADSQIRWQNPVRNGEHALTMGAVSQGSMCPCGAWLGSLGLDPTPDLYVEHIVECFRHVRRVLRDDGTLWVNLGDSYAGSGKGPSGQNGIGDQSERQGWDGSRRTGTDKSDSNRGSQKYALVNGGKAAVGLKSKDLMMIPFRVAMALQADGWWLRSVIPWLKRNSMPESCRDRPSTSTEYVFLLSKSSRYMWDADAVRQPASENTHSRRNGTGKKNGTIAFGQGIRNNEDFTSRINGHVTSRNRRNSDWFFESWQGLMLDEQGEPLALVVNPQPFKERHFATFPPKLVEPMVKASTRPGDVILDPFGGAGTVGLVADRLGRNAVLVDLKPEYSTMAVDRLTGDAPLFVQVNEAPA